MFLDFGVDSPKGATLNTKEHTDAAANVLAADSSENDSLSVTDFSHLKSLEINIFNE